MLKRNRWILIPPFPGSNPGAPASYSFDFGIFFCRGFLPRFGGHFWCPTCHRDRLCVFSRRAGHQKSLQGHFVVDFSTPPKSAIGQRKKMRWAIVAVMSRRVRTIVVAFESKQCALLSPVNGQPRGLAHQHLRIELSWLPTVYDGCGDVGRQPRQS
jgi:hypothetical protein